jgi:hypothetical protein
MWLIADILIRDAAGNTFDIGPKGLDARGLPSSVAVTSRLDKTPPTLTAFSIAPGSVATRATAQLVTFTATATDSQSGATEIVMGGGGSKVNTPHEPGFVVLHKVPGTADKLQRHKATCICRSTSPTAAPPNLAKAGPTILRRSPPTAGRTRSP